MSHTVLIITNNAADAQVLKATLATAKDGPFIIEWARHLSDASARIGKGGIDLILTDLFLPDSQGIATFDSLSKLALPTPILTLCDEDSEHLGVEAVQRGAQGYLSKGHFQNSLTPQALRNIIQRKKVEEALYIEKERARVTLESIGDGVLSTDATCKITYLNAEAERMTGWTRAEAHGRQISEVFHLLDSETRLPAPNPVEPVIQKRKPIGLFDNSVLIRRDGFESPIEGSSAPIFDQKGEVTGAVVTFRDVSETRAMTQRMTYLGQHDYLTGLPNRMLFHDRLMQAIAYAQRHNTQLAVLFLDLDNFKHINDSLGHTVGDKLLQSVAGRLVAQVRHSDTVCRQGGDEFVILVLEDAHAEDATIIADKIVRAVTQPHHVEGHELHITTSIGLSVYPADGDDADTLIRNADMAMYVAKKKGKNCYQFFNAEMNARAMERRSMEVELRRAIDREELILHYQPKVDLVSGEITGAEALARWHHPQKGMIFPETFIPVAEECGLIIPLGRFVLRRACRQMKTWRDAGGRQLSIAVNVSPLEFRDHSFLECVRTVLHEEGVDGKFLQLELTESTLMRNVEASRAILHELKALGVQLAVDDFGTGYSSLSYLRLFPIDVLKIDQSFVQDISADTENGTIVSAVISMGAGLRHKVIAEGIETEEQLSFLNAHHCNEGQGYFFSRPVPADDFAKLV